jgi:dienelactone hydrolase
VPDGCIRGHQSSRIVSIRPAFEGVAEAVADLASAIAYGRTLPNVRPGPVLLAGQSRGGFLAMHYARLKPGDVMAVVHFVGGCYPTDR